MQLTENPFRWQCAVKNNALPSILYFLKYIGNRVNLHDTALPSNDGNCQEFINFKWYFSSILLYSLKIYP